MRRTMTGCDVTRSRGPLVSTKTLPNGQTGEKSTTCGLRPSGHIEVDWIRYVLLSDVLNLIFLDYLLFDVCFDCVCIRCLLFSVM